MATTAAAVQELLGSDYDGKRSVAPFLRASANVVARVVACALARNLTLTASEQDELQCWLAAHYYTRSDKAYQAKSTGGASATFQGQTAMGLQGSYYGQSALELDYTGCLAALSTQRRASLTWGGKTDGEKLAYEDRN